MPLVFDILIHLRTYAIALTSDTEKVFHQVSVHEKDIEFLRFLWFDNVFLNQPKIVPNRFAWVIFGVTCSPFLLNEAIRKYAKSYELYIWLVLGAKTEIFGQTFLFTNGEVMIQN